MMTTAATPAIAAHILQLRFCGRGRSCCRVSQPPPSTSIGDTRDTGLCVDDIAARAQRAVDRWKKRCGPGSKGQGFGINDPQHTKRVRSASFTIVYGPWQCSRDNVKPAICGLLLREGIGRLQGHTIRAQASALSELATRQPVPKLLGLCLQLFTISDTPCGRLQARRLGKAVGFDADTRYQAVCTGLAYECLLDHRHIRLRDLPGQRVVSANFIP